MAANTFVNNSLTADSPAQGAVVVVPGTAYTALIGGLVFRGLWVGGAGDVSIVMADGNTAVFKSVPAGTLLPVMSSQVTTVNTTATNMLALY